MLKFIVFHYLCLKAFLKGVREGYREASRKNRE